MQALKLSKDAKDRLAKLKELSAQAEGGDNKMRFNVLPPIIRVTLSRLLPSRPLGTSCFLLAPPLPKGTSQDKKHRNSVRQPSCLL